MHPFLLLVSAQLLGSNMVVDLYDIHKTREFGTNVFASQ
jgi:hypothetical protein